MVKSKKLAPVKKIGARQKKSFLASRKLPQELKKLSAGQLETLCREIRAELLTIVMQNGGHLASNLGAVELTVALHAVLNSPVDKIIWDVGHQAYVHKMLTGRHQKMATLRQFGGLSGFPKRSESKHDIFGAGHASTSLSAALGIAKARDLDGEKFAVAAVIGDGAMSGGLAFEAINNTEGQIMGPFMVILNDNGMSISRPVGALSALITRIRTSSPYLTAKKQFEGLLNRIPRIGQPLSRKVEKLVDRTKNLVTDFKVGVIFEELGFRYLGPIDGHNIAALMSAIAYALRSTKPVMIHVITVKGKGYAPCEKDPENFHGIAPRSEKEHQSKPFASFTATAGQALCALAATDLKICAITAAMPQGTGLTDFARLFPRRFFDVGIAEEHAVTFAGGLAAQGYKPFVAIYSTFLQRSYDQLIHDICLQNLPVVFLVDRCGLVGADGPTHHGVFDIAYLRSIPNLTILSPVNNHELVLALKWARRQSFPVAIRYPRGQANARAHLLKPQPRLVWGQGAVVYTTSRASQDSAPRPRVGLAAPGRLLGTALEAASQLESDGLEVTVINPRFLKPLDRNLWRTQAAQNDLLVTLEDGVLAGGFGSAVLETLQAWGVDTRQLLLIGLPDSYIEHGSIAELDQAHGLDVASVVTRIKQRLNMR